MLVRRLSNVYKPFFHRNSIYSFQACPSCQIQQGCQIQALAPHSLIMNKASSSATLAPPDEDYGADQIQVRLFTMQT